MNSASAFDVLAAEGFPLLPDVDVRPIGLVVDLLARPGLQVDRARRLHALALRDLPGVRPRVVHERLRVEELEGGARKQIRRATARPSGIAPRSRSRGGRCGAGPSGSAPSSTPPSPCAPSPIGEARRSPARPPRTSARRRGGRPLSRSEASRAGRPVARRRGSRRARLRDRGGRPLLLGRRCRERDSTPTTSPAGHLRERTHVRHSANKGTRHPPKVPPAVILSRAPALGIPRSQRSSG